MAAENGDAYGMYSVAYMILNGQCWWVDKSIGKEWLKKSAAPGNESAINLLEKINNKKGLLKNQFIYEFSNSLFKFYFNRLDSE